jgi:hypothetical protein
MMMHHTGANINGSSSPAYTAPPVYGKQVANIAAPWFEDFEGAPSFERWWRLAAHDSYRRQLYLQLPRAWPGASRQLPGLQQMLGEEDDDFPVCTPVQNGHVLCKPGVPLRDLSLHEIDEKLRNEDFYTGMPSSW